MVLSEADVPVQAVRPVWGFLGFNVYGYKN